MAHPILEENFKIVSLARDQNGLPFKIIRIPLPPPTLRMVSEKDNIYQYLQMLRFEKPNHVLPETIKVISASSYCNFLISNGVVLVAKYYKEGRDIAFKKADEQALEIFQNVFSDRKIIQIEDVENVNFGGGGMHCITQQQPCLVSKY